MWLVRRCTPCASASQHFRAQFWQHCSQSKQHLKAARPKRYEACFLRSSWDDGRHEQHRARSRVRGVPEQPQASNADGAGFAWSAGRALSRWDVMYGMECRRSTCQSERRATQTARALLGAEAVPFPRWNVMYGMECRRSASHSEVGSSRNMGTRLARCTWKAGSRDREESLC